MRLPLGVARKRRRDPSPRAATPSRLLAASVAATLAIGVAPLSRAADGDSVRLVLVLVIDQLRRDRLDPELPGGLGALVRGGRVFRDSVVDHGTTETCPGHLVVVSGRHPAGSGIPSNRAIDRETGEERYCVVDSSPRGEVLAHPAAEGRSPARIRVDTLGDWMKTQRPETRVYSVSGKDRSAVTLGGQQPDAAYWFQRKGRVGFTTSRYYMAELPGWVKKWNGENPPQDGFLSRVSERWDHAVLPKPRNGRVRPDSFASENAKYGRTSGHGIADSDLEEFGERFYHSPFLDNATLEFARQVVLNEGLGRGSGADLLAIGLSATDLIGHLYGPESHEAIDGLARLDVALGDFLAFLDDQLGPGRVLVALTSDHGVLPLPEWLEQTGRGRCRVAGGRMDVRWMAAGLYWRLHTRLARFFSLPARWVEFAGSQVTVNRSVAREREVPVERVMDVVVEYLEELDAIARVWTAEEIARETGPVARLYRNSYDPERSGDLVVELADGCLLTPGAHGTTHGTPHLYDRAVPLVFYGPGVTRGTVGGKAASVDVAPTLAAHLGVSAPDGLDGRPLPLRGVPQSSPSGVDSGR